MLDSAATASNAAHVAGPSSINHAGRFGGVKVSHSGGAGGTSQAGASRGGEQPSPVPPTPPVAPGGGPGGGSDDKGDGDDKEDEEARASNFYHTPDVARVRIKEVIRRLRIG